MRASNSCRSALALSFFRGYHSVNDTPRIFNDFLAYPLLGQELHSLLVREFTPSPEFIAAIDPEFAASRPDRTASLAWRMRTISPAPLVISRARYAEDTLLQTIGQGVGQYVILGAGMDSFAFRRPDILDKFQVFELDRPETQALKRQRIAELGWEPPRRLHFIPADFTRESPGRALARSSYDPLTPGFFNLMGITRHLPPERVFAMFRSVADIAPSGSAMVFDYLDPAALLSGREAGRLRIADEHMGSWGKPVSTCLDPTALARELSSLGLRLFEDLGPADIEGLYFRGRTDGYYAYEHIHLALAVVE